MIKAYKSHGACVTPIEHLDDAGLLDADWIDLLNPTHEEEKRIEALCGIEAPTREEMQEIEISNRLYIDNGVFYMTAIVIAKLNSRKPDSSPITFILAKDKLVTLRYAEPRSFAAFASRACRTGSGYRSGALVMIGLFEAMINRQADVLEELAIDIDILSHDVFDHDAKKDRRRDFQDIMRRLGSKGILISKIRESLVSIARVTHFGMEAIGFDTLAQGADVRSRMKALDKDIISLLDHVTYLGGKIGFLLDATLGVINIDQNNTFRVFSIMSVVLLPPTLIGAIYGMNFNHMPELDWKLGYPLALGMMLLSAILPLAWFRKKGWL